MASNTTDTGQQYPAPSSTMQYVSMPMAPDMTEMYSVMAENMDFQNEISSAQLELAQSQLEIAEDLHGKSQLFRPVEKKVLTAARVGYDPNFYAARERNAVIQANKQLAGQASRSAAARGISPSSPSTVAASIDYAGEMGRRAGEVSETSRESTAQQNIAAKTQAVGLGANIPSQVVSGYGTAIASAGRAGTIAGQAASQVANQMGIEQQMALQQQQLAAQTSYWNAQLGLQQQELAQREAQNTASNAFAREQSEAATEAAMWGAVPVVGPVIGAASGGSHICTELLRQGLVNETLYVLSCIFDDTLPRQVVDGYRLWAIHVAMAMRRSRLLTAIAKPLAIAYMSFAASRVVGSKPPLLGVIVYRVGAPLCNLIGYFVKRK